MAPKSTQELNNLMESFQPVAETRPVQEADRMPGSTQLNWNPTTYPVKSSPVEEMSSYMDQMFAEDQAKNWKVAPPVVKQEEESLGGSVWGAIKGAGEFFGAIPKAATDKYESVFHNKITSQWITNLSEYNTKMAGTTSNTERQQAQQDMLKKGTITDDYFKKQEDTRTETEVQKQSYAKNAETGFKDELSAALLPYTGVADKMQLNYINSSKEKLTNQYMTLWNNINDSYDGTSFDKKVAFDQLNNSLIPMLKDTAINFSKKIMEGKDSQTAYTELVPTMKDTFSNIADFGLNLNKQSTIAARDHFYGRLTEGTVGGGIMGTIGLIGNTISQATQNMLTTPIEYGKQALLSEYDVVEDLRSMGVYKENASVWEKAGALGSELGWNIISASPQIAPMAAIMVSEFSIGNIPTLATLTKGSKLKTFISEAIIKDTAYNGIVQASLWRGMTEDDIAMNLMIGLPIGGALGILEKPMKAQLDATWLKKFGTDYGFTPSNTVSTDVLQLLNTGNKEAAMTMHLADVTGGKMGDITIGSLNAEKQAEIASMQKIIAQSVDNVSQGKYTLQEWVLVDSAAKTVIEERSMKDVIKNTDLNSKVVNHIKQQSWNPDSYLSNQRTFSAIAGMLRNDTISHEEVNTMLDGIKNDLSGVKIGHFKATDETVNDIINFAKQMFTGEEWISKTLIDSPQKMQLFNLVQNELYKNIAIAKSMQPWTDIGKYVITDGQVFVDKVTRQQISQEQFVSSMDLMKAGAMEKTRLESIYDELKTITDPGQYANVLGINNILQFAPQLSKMIDGLMKSQVNIGPAVLAWRIKNIIDGNINILKMSPEDISLMKLLMLPGIIAKGKSTTAEIAKDNAWNLWNKEGQLNLQFANPQRVQSMVGNVLKDGEASDIVSVVGDIVGIDKNMVRIKDAGSFDKALTESIAEIPNEVVQVAVGKEIQTALPKPEINTTTFYRWQKAWEGFTSEYGDAGPGLYLAERHQEAISYLPKTDGKIYEFNIPISTLKIKDIESFGTATDKNVIPEGFDGARELATWNIVLRKDFTHDIPKEYSLSDFQDKIYGDYLKTQKVSTLDGAQILHDIVDTVKEDKVFMKAVDDTEELIQKEFTEGIMKGKVRTASRKIKILTVPENMDNMKENIGGWMIGWATIEPLEIKTFQDQIEAIEAIMKAGGVTDKAFVRKVTDSIGTLWVLKFDKVEQLTQDSMSKLLSWSRSEVKFKTGTLVDLKNGVDKDIKNFVEEVAAIKETAKDPVDMYRQILRTNYKYASTLYSHILAGQTGKYIDELANLTQVAGDIRFLSSDQRLDKFMDSVKSELLKVEMSDIHNLTFKSYDQIDSKENIYRGADDVFKVKRLQWGYYVKNGKMPPLIHTNNIQLGEWKIAYVVTNDIGISDIKNPIKISWQSDAYKFISLTDLISGNYEKGNDIFLPQRMTNRLMSNDGDKLKLNTRLDIVGILKHIIGNKDVKVMDIDVYSHGKELVIQTSDLNKADTFLKIKTMESDLVYQNAIQSFIHGFATDTISGYKGMRNEILDDNKKMLEHIYLNLSPKNKLRPDAAIKTFFEKYGVTDKTQIKIDDVVANMFNELYQYGALYRTIAKDTLADSATNMSISLKNIATSYNLKKEYTNFLDNLPSNPDLMVGNSNIHDIFTQLMEENKGDITEAATALYSIMIKDSIPLSDIKAGMNSIFKVYGYDSTLPAYIHNILFPSVDVFRAQQVADAVLSTVAGKRKQTLVDSFNGNIEENLKTFHRTHFGTDTHMIKFLETLQKKGYINEDVNIYQAALILGEKGDRMKTMLKQLYNTDIVRLIDDTEWSDNIYRGIQSNISKVVDNINMGTKFKKVELKQVLDEWMSLEEQASIKEMSQLEDEAAMEALVGSSISTKQEIDVSGLVLSFKQSIDELIHEEADILSLKGNYSNTGKREIIWSEPSTFKIAGFGAEDKGAIIEQVSSAKNKFLTESNLAFTVPVRWGHSKVRVGANIFHALNGTSASDVAADAYNIIAKSDLSSEHDFIRQVKPTFFFPNNVEMKMTGESNLESANFIKAVLDQMNTIQEQLLKTTTKEETKKIEHTIFSMVTEKGFKQDINSDSLINFPVWKGYLNRLYKANPDFFGEPLSNTFLFKQLEQLNKFTNNVLVEIGKTINRADLFSSVKNPRLDTYRNLQTSIQKVLDNYSNITGIARTGFESTMFEGSSHAESIENMLRTKKGLSQVISKDTQKMFGNVSRIELIGYSPVVKHTENGEELMTEKVEKIIPIENIEAYIDNMSGQFINKSEVHPWDFGIENLDLHIRVETRRGDVFEVKIDKGVEEVKQVELVGWNYKKNNEPLLDIHEMLQPATAKDYQSMMETYTC